MTNAIDEALDKQMYKTGGYVEPTYTDQGVRIGTPQPFTLQPDMKVYTSKPDLSKLLESFGAPDPLAEAQRLIAETCDEIKALLLEKNRKYGNSALEPSRIFSKSNPVEQIKVRIDDKLTRLKNQAADEDEDVVKDLMGYLVLLRVAQKLSLNV